MPYRVVFRGEAGGDAPTVLFRGEVGGDPLTTTLDQYGVNYPRVKLIPAY